MIFKARYRKRPEKEFQTLVAHLNETGLLAEIFGRKLGLDKPALLIGLVHDLGKYSKEWAAYLEENNEEEKHQGKRKRKEKKDHGAAGGQFLYQVITENFGDAGELTGLMLAACIMYHHGPGLPDVIEPDGTPKLYNRLAKPEEEVHTEEATANLDPAIKQRIENILSDKDFITGIEMTLKGLIKTDVKQARFFNLGLTARFLSSCLIDADRRSSACFEQAIPVTEGNAVMKADWRALRELLEAHLMKFSAEDRLNEIRRQISDNCAGFALRPSGIYTLTAATGAGKTLASLRYALVHAERMGKDHIFIIAPYTSILDQNAALIRKILDPDGENGRIVLEHHSNLDQSEVTEHTISSMETWNVPIIITTMVQFLEALFGPGTRKIRRMHQLVNSVIIFDEVQALPVSCTYLFTWAVKYLCQKTYASILLCTATQPGLNKLEAEFALPLSAENEIIPNITTHFEDLKRVELIDKTRPGGRTLDDAAGFIGTLKERSVLTVVNTKPQARKLYAILSQNHPDWKIVYLSTDLCPRHRKKLIAKLKVLLRDKKYKTACISTRLIEAGVDIDFDAAVRFLAGYDSLVQTAGRCNRDGKLRDSLDNPIAGKTYIINIAESEENISRMPELIRGREVTKYILDKYRNKRRYNHNLLHPDIIVEYFNEFYDRSPESAKKYGVYVKRKDNILELLSENSRSAAEYTEREIRESPDNPRPLTDFCQSFESAWEKFKVIDQNTFGVIVPFKKGKDMIDMLYELPDAIQCGAILAQAQPYSVNLYFNELENLEKRGIVMRIPTKNQFEIYALAKEYYDKNMGLTIESGGLDFLYA
jgi:CRISPR-associated endonuclease/helicase Cas3